MAYFLASYASAGAPQPIQYIIGGLGTEVEGKEAQIYLKFFEHLMNHMSP